MRALLSLVCMVLFTSGLAFSMSYDTKAGLECRIEKTKNLILVKGEKANEVLDNINYLAKHISTNPYQVFEPLVHSVEWYLDIVYMLECHDFYNSNKLNTYNDNIKLYIDMLREINPNAVYIWLLHIEDIFLQYTYDTNYINSFNQSIDKHILIEFIRHTVLHAFEDDESLALIFNNISSIVNN